MVQPDQLRPHGRGGATGALLQADARGRVRQRPRPARGVQGPRALAGQPGPRRLGRVHRAAAAGPGALARLRAGPARGAAVGRRGAQFVGHPGKQPRMSSPAASAWRCRAADVASQEALSDHAGLVMGHGQRAPCRFPHTQRVIIRRVEGVLRACTRPSCPVPPTLPGALPANMALLCRAGRAGPHGRAHAARFPQSPQTQGFTPHQGLVCALNKTVLVKSDAMGDGDVRVMPRPSWPESF